MRDVTDEEREQINKIFTYHAPKGDQVERYAWVREMARKFCIVIFASCPPSAERTLAMRRLQEAVMYANAAIAINEEQG